MFFIASKIFWMLVQPLNALCFIALAGFGIRYWRRGLGERIMWGALAWILFLGIVPLGPIVLNMYERSFEAPQQMPDHVSGIIVLGGMFDAHLSESTGQISANDNIERMMCFTSLAKKYPEARKVFSGGSGDINHPEAKEAAVAADYLKVAGINNDSIIYERDSRNTFENAEFSKELVNPMSGQKWVLITSAYHMPRSVGIFEKLRWKVIPYPCDYKTDPDYFDYFQTAPDVVRNFAMLNIVVKELIGSVVYYITGKSAFILPRERLPSGL